MRIKILNIIGIPLITFGLFAFQCSDPRYYLSELVWCFLISAMLWLGNGMLIKILNQIIPWRSSAMPRVVIQLVISVLFTVWLTYFAVKFLYSGVYEAHFSSLVFRGNLFVFLIISLLYNAIYTGGHLFEKWRQSIVETEEWKRQILLSQYEALKNQVNPHFLFNSLNTLIGLIDDHPDLAKEFGHQFAEIFRQVLIKGKKELIYLREELEVVQILSQLFKTRFRDGFEVRIDISEAVLDKRVLPLALHQLMENAVKHNQVSANHPLTIDITSTKGYLIVSNNLNPKNLQTPSTESGLENIIKRYQFLTSDKVVVREEKNVFSVELPLLDNK